MALRHGALNESERADAVTAIRTFLLTSEKPGKTSDESWEALRIALAWEAFLTQIVMPLEWGAGYGSYLQVENRKRHAALAAGDYARYGTPEAVFEHLFAYFFRLLCRDGKKELTRNRFLEELENPSIAPSERGILQLLLDDELGAIRQEISEVKTSVQQKMEALSHQVGELGKAFGASSQFGLSAAVFSSDPPEDLAGGATRSTAVTAILDLLEAGRAVLLFGEFGSGKTQLLLLTSAKLSKRQFWLSISREASEAQADAMPEAFLRSLARTTQRLPFWQMCEAACQQLGQAVVIFDDLPRIIPRGQFATRIEIFVSGGRLPKRRRGSNSKKPRIGTTPKSCAAIVSPSLMKAAASSSWALPTNSHDQS